MPKIAVLIPTYNPGDYIVRCLKGLNDQTLDRTSFKLYVALNGSDEKHSAYLKSVISGFDFDCEVFVLEKAGVSSARNFLIENSTEEYIAFVDDDDFVTPEYLEGMLSVSSSTVIGVSDVCSFFEDVGERKEHYVGLCFKGLSEITFSKFKSRKYFSSPWAKLIHRDIVKGVRFDTRLDIGEDALFMAQISRRVLAIRKATLSSCYNVCERPGSATRGEINRKKELSRIMYLLWCYGRMLLSFRYNVFFILSRMVATVMHVRRVFDLRGRN